MESIPDLSRSLVNFSSLPLFSNESWWYDLLLLGLIILCLVFSAFFSSTETALTSSNTIRLRNLMDENVRGARKAVFLSERYDETITAILIGNNLVNISASTLSASMFTRIVVLGPTWSNVLSTITMTIIVLIFAEILPKTFAKKSPEKSILARSGAMWVVLRIFTPITWVFMQIQKLASKIRGNDDEEIAPSINERELESIIDVMEGEGVIDEDRADLIQSALALENRFVSEIMTPRVDIEAIEVSMSTEEIYKAVYESKFSRVPVYEGDKDNILGILPVKDFIFAIVEAGNDLEKIDIRSLLTESLYVNKNVRVDDLLTEMQAAKKHMAIVVDEFGGTSGIVTMEDALEELVGEIYDEYDEVEQDEIIKLGEDHYSIPPDFAVEDLFEELELGDEPKHASSSVGGFVYRLSTSLPEAGMEIEYEHEVNIHDVEKTTTIQYLLTFVVKEVENRRISKLELFVKKLGDEEDIIETVETEDNE